MSSSSDARPRVLIAGLGYVGSVLASALEESGAEVFGLKRKRLSVEVPYQLIYADLLGNLDDVPSSLHSVVYMPSADTREVSAYKAAYVDGVQNLLRLFATRNESPRILYVSSTGVYGENSGEWVDEDTHPAPAVETAKVLREGEEIVAASGLQFSILRLSGIYGPGRTRQIRRVVNASPTVHATVNHYSNHIHRDDAASAIQFLLSKSTLDSTYLITDCYPVAETEMQAWLADNLGMARPQVPGEGALSTGKRCSNERLLNCGYRFKFPTYKEGYGALLESEGAVDR